jgi:hypothetical protein
MVLQFCKLHVNYTTVFPILVFWKRIIYSKVTVTCSIDLFFHIQIEKDNNN